MNGGAREGMTMAKTTVTRWWLIRHAPVVGTHGRVYGQMDVGCDVSDTASFKALAARVPDDALWFTTPLSRTLRTAEALGEQIRAAGRPAPPDPVVDAAFIEQSFGAWQGLTYREIGAYGQTETAHRFWLAPAVETPASSGVVDTPPRTPPALEGPLPEASNSPGTTPSPADPK